MGEAPDPLGIEYGEPPPPDSTALTSERPRSIAHAIEATRARRSEEP